MCMERSADTRHTAETRLNDRSSRSHALFTIMIEKDDSMPGQTERHITQGKLNLVDLAGSERVRLTGATGDRLKETKKINLSLSALGNVISALVDGRPHVPYRDSKLTRLLEDSLGGNCKTTLVATISPALEFFGESLSTLKFANRAKNIRNHATINEDIGKQSLLQKYQRELKKLREQLKHKNADLVDKRHFLKLESECQRHKEDKMKVLHALEERSLEVEAEKQERQKLEEEIQDLQDKMVDVDGVAETEGFRTAIAEIENDYKHKERELEDKWMALDEKERQQNYIKGLLVRQRDVLIQVTNKLNMLDQESEEWKEKEDGYRSRIRQLEDDLDEEMKRTFAARKENLMNFEDGEGGGAASDSKVRELEFMVETLRSEKHHLSMELEKKEDELADTQRLVNENVAKYLSDSAVIQEVNKMKTKSKSKLSATVGAAVSSTKELLERANQLQEVGAAPLKTSSSWVPANEGKSVSVSPVTTRDARLRKSPPPPIFGSKVDDRHIVGMPNYLRPHRDPESRRPAPVTVSEAPRDKPASESRPTTAGSRGKGNDESSEEIKSRVDQMIAARKAQISRQRQEVDRYLQ